MYAKNVNGNYGCSQCKFGFRGKLDINNEFIEECFLNDQDCDLSKYVLGIENPILTNFFSCHKCKNTNLIPVIFIDTENTNFTEFTFW